MTSKVIEFEDLTTLVGAGAVQQDDLKMLLNVAPRLVAADGGAKHALAINVIPDAVIGDFDSFSSDCHNRIPNDQKYHVGEQDSTDFEKTLSRISAPLIFGIGFTGPRIDHQLAAFSCLIRFAHQRCILIDSVQVIFLCPPEVEILCGQNTLISLFPMVPLSAESTGLYWPLDGLKLGPDQVIGTSNCTERSKVCLRVNRPGLLVILRRKNWACVMNALIASSSNWPVQ
ncbi:MAG: thiamine diphosphokinase [Aestuariivita sp.]|nr:thiamine diphosphokinase [Aestuariivita sp.]